MMAPSFVNITNEEDGIDLLDLIPNGEYASGDIVVQTLTAGGLADKTYSFVKPRRGDWQWQDDDDATVEKGAVKFKPGTGLWIAGVDNVSLTVAGAVSKADRVVPLQDGATATGNFTPVQIDLLSIIPGGDYASGDIVIQTLTAGGLADKTYSFVKPRRGDWQWQNDDDETVEEGTVFFAPGKGLWVAGVDGATITIPGPTL